MPDAKTVLMVDGHILSVTSKLIGMIQEMQSCWMFEIIFDLFYTLEYAILMF